MGKHDKHEEQKVEFKWEPPKDEWYKARITELKEENARLRLVITEKDKTIAVYEQTVDYHDAMHNGTVAELKDLLDEKDDEIAVLQGKISMLEKAIVNGALREVLA